MFCSQLWYTPEQYELVKRAANIDRRPMTTFAILAVLKAARLVLDSVGDPCVEPMPRTRKKRAQKT